MDFPETHNSTKVITLGQPQELNGKTLFTTKNITLVILLGESKLILTLKRLPCWVAFKELGGTL